MTADAPTLTPVPVATLRRHLDGDYAEIRDMVREGLSRPDIGPVDPEIDREEYQDLVLDWARELATTGRTSLGFPRTYGGEANIGGSVAAFETLGFGDLSLLVKTGVQFGLFGGAILHLGTEHHHERYLRDVITLDLPGCFAMTESGHGSNVQELETTATYDPATQEFVVHTPGIQARKDYIGNAGRHGRLAAVFAQLVVEDVSHGVHCLLVPIRDDRGRSLDGVTLEDCGHKLGLNGVDNGRITFDHVRVPREALLDRFASVSSEGVYSSPIDNPNRRFFTMLGTLVQGRVSVSGAAISAAKVAITIAVRHALQRRQFGPPGGEGEILLLDYLAHQRRLLTRLARTYALSAAQERLIEHLHAVFTAAQRATPGSADDTQERERRQLETSAAGIKALTTWHATDVIQTGREACGGLGYMSENRFAALKADTDVFTTFEGDNTILLQLVAKSLLTDFQDEFGELEPLEMARFLAEQVVEAVIERTSARQLVERLVDAVPSRDDDAGLYDRDWHRELFRWREDHLLAGVARRLKRGFDDGDEPFDVFNRCQDHIIAVARANVERIVLEGFVDRIETVSEPELRELLDLVCDLHVLSEIERDRGWFQEHGRLSGARSKAVVSAVNDRCRQLRPHARTLVDAFGIPDQWLAPIALGLPD